MKLQKKLQKKKLQKNMTAAIVLGAAGAGSPLATAQGGDCVVPTLVGSIEHTNFWQPHLLEAEGTTVYAAGLGGWMAIYDVSDPTNPVLSSNYYVNVPGPYVFVFSMTISNGKAYFAIDGISFQGIRIADVSRPDAPFDLGIIEVADNLSLTATGNTLFSRSRLSDTPPELRAFDVSSPTAPSFIGDFTTPGELGGFTAQGDLLYVSDGSFGLEILDTSTPGAMSLVGLYSAPGFVADYARVSGSRAYVRGNDVLSVIDVSDPTSPTLLGSYTMTIGPSIMRVEGNTVYLASNDLLEMRVLDASDPTSITQIGVYDIPQAIIAMAVSGDYVYLSGSQLRVIDVSNSCAQSCPADLSGDGLLNFFDVSLFLGAFAQGDLIADFTGDGNFDFFDVSAFLTAFAAGCP